MVHYPNFPDVDKLTCCICRIPISTSPTIEYMSDSLSEEDSVPQFMKQVWKCQGIKFDFPKGRSPCVEWPWGEQAELSMAWNVHIQCYWCLEGKHQSCILRQSLHSPHICAKLSPLGVLVLARFGRQVCRQKLCKPALAGQYSSSSYYHHQFMP